MSARQASKLAFFVPAVVCLAVAVSLLVPMSRRLGADMYWTPSENAPRLDDVRDRVEIYLDGELIQRRAESGELRLQEQDVGSADLTVRLNNVDRVERAQQLIAAATGGAGLALLIAGMLLPRASTRRTERS